MSDEFSGFVDVLAEEKKIVQPVLLTDKPPLCQRPIQLKNGGTTYCMLFVRHEGACQPHRCFAEPSAPVVVAVQHETCEVVNPKTGQRCGCPKGHEALYSTHSNGGRAWL